MLLELKENRKFQALFGMLQWIHTIGRPELGPLLTTLNHFVVAPRKGHLELAICSFCYLKFNKGREIVINSRPIQFARMYLDYDMLRPDFLEYCTHKKREVNPNLPAPHGSPLEVSTLVDYEHAHDLIMKRLMTGLLVYFGFILVYWSAKRQGYAATST